jgi:hypothetical protein
MKGRRRQSPEGDVSTSDDVITLKGGIVLPVPAFQLAWRLEDRGCTFHVDPETGQLVVNHDNVLTDADRAQIRTWREALIVIAQYEAPPII